MGNDRITTTDAAGAVSDLHNRQQQHQGDNLSSTVVNWMIDSAKNGGTQATRDAFYRSIAADDSLKQYLPVVEFEDSQLCAKNGTAYQAGHADAGPGAIAVTGNNDGSVQLGNQRVTIDQNTGVVDSPAAAGAPGKDWKAGSYDNNLVTVTPNGDSRNITIKNANGPDTVLTGDDLTKKNVNLAPDGVLTYDSTPGTHVKIGKDGTEITTTDQPDANGNTSVTRTGPGGRVTDRELPNGTKVHLQEDGSWTWTRGNVSYQYDANSHNIRGGFSGSDVETDRPPTIDSNGNIHFSEKADLGLTGAKARRVDDSGKIVDDADGGDVQYQNWNK